MATYYVSPSGSNTAPYDTWAKAANLISTAITAGNAVAGPHALYIAPGTYVDTLAPTDSDWAGSTITFTAAHGSTNPGVYGLTYVNPPDNTAPLTLGGANDITISGHPIFTAGGTANLLNNGGAITGLLIDGAHFISRKNNSNHGLYFANASGKMKNFSVQHNRTGSHYSLRQILGTMDYENYRFTASGYGAVAGEVRVQGGTAYFDNGVVLDRYQHGINAVGGTVYVRNSIVCGSIAASDGRALVRGSGALHAINNLLIAPLYPTQYVSGTLDTNTNNTLGGNPAFTSYSRPGYICVRIDDSGSLAYAQAIADAMVPYGFTGSLAINQYNWSGADDEALRSMVRQGVFEVANHTYSHTHVGYDYALNFSQSGGTNPTVAFDGSTITLSCDGEDYDMTIDVTNTLYNSLNKIISAFNGVKGWTIAKSTTGGQVVERVGDAKATSLKILTTTAAPCDIQFNRTGYNVGFYKDEITDAKTWVESIVNANGDIIDPQTGAAYRCRTLQTPFNSYHADAMTAAQNAGYVGSGNNRISYPDTLSDVNAWSVFAYGIGNIIDDGTEAKVRRGAKSFGFAVAHSGLVVSVLSHAYLTDEITMEQWGWIFDEWSKIPGLNVTSLQTAIDEIKSTHTDDGDGTWSKVYADSTDYHLLPTSPCIGAGVDVGITTDADGAVVPGAVGYDIGPYSYMPGWTVFDGTMPPLCLAAACPGSLLEVQEWTKANITKRQIDAVSR